MRIAYFSDVYYPYVSGVVVSIANFSRELIAKGHSVKLYTSTPLDASAVPKVAGLEVVRLKASTALANYPGFTAVAPSNALQLGRMLDAFAPDVLHAHTPTFVGWYAYYYAHRHRLPLVSTYHTFLPELRDQIIPFNWMHKRTAEYLLSAYSRFHYNQSDLVIAPSRVISEKLLELGIKKRVEVVSNGVDLSKFQPKAANQGTFRFLHVGRLSREKNVDVVLQAFKQVVEHRDAELWIVGQGPDAERLKLLTSQLGLDAAVKFCGTIPNADLADVYASASAFVTASTFETEGIVLLEAMASGLAIVGVDKLAIPSLVKNGSNGFVVPPFDVKAFSDSMTTLIAQPDLLHNFQKHAAIRAKEFSLQASVLKMEGLYQELVSTFNPKPN